ncbi:hypothetical protein JHK82_045824 [Glycine max]|uniref:Uncharacterized protein n=1 Tax=Glycine max TaxID=3847 RepID=A0A0R0FK79_SOYBN|nr:hypothetical protein JHK87_043985 [Glycine soja]KAG4950874.1 hypothetical protein JHK85_044741 [Glycine max]KAG5100772.1 hypothetical protein JHK82_045824 [Glycine max]KAG5107356.1 hypothetical protein JHK84_044263 [Glycine max]KAH1149563.1 hypothetical protein GYH30_043885 [Glycine max]
MLVVKEYIVLSDQASFPPIICFQILFRPKPWYPPAEDQKHTPRFIRGLHLLTDIFSYIKYIRMYGIKP